MKISTLRLYVIINVFSLIIALMLNYLAVSLPLNNKTTKQLSDLYPNYFVPEGFTFSIWGIIYLLMSIFVFYQLYMYLKRNLDALEPVIAIGPLFFFTGIANGLWIIAWHYEMVMYSVFLMLWLLISLIRIYFILLKSTPLTSSATIFIRTFFSVYLGWICVATIANITAFLVSSGFTSLGFDGHIWAVIMITVATILGVVFCFKFHDIGFGLVIVWAIAGIYFKQSGSNLEGAQLVAIVSKFAGTALLLYVVLLIIGKKTYYSSSKEPNLLVKN
jgi:hypothetical protein